MTFSTNSEPAAHVNGVLSPMSQMTKELAGEKEDVHGMLMRIVLSITPCCETLAGNIVLEKKNEIHGGGTYRQIQAVAEIGHPGLPGSCFRSWQLGPEQPLWQQVSGLWNRVYVRCLGEYGRTAIL